MRHDEKGANPTGQTLIETVLACLLMVVIYGAGLSLSVETRDAWTHLYHDTGALQAAREALHLLATDLATSAPDRVNITTGTDHDTLQFQVPTGLDDEGDIVWGAADQPNWSIRITVIDGNLVRQILDETGNPAGSPRLLVRNVDTTYRGERGFAVSRSGQMCTVRLRLRLEQEGHVWRQEVSTGVLLRND